MRNTAWLTAAPRLRTGLGVLLLLLLWLNASTTVAQPKAMPCSKTLARTPETAEMGILLCFCDDWIANTQQTYRVPFFETEIEDLQLTRHFQIDSPDSLRSLTDSVYMYFGGIAPGGAIYFNDKLVRLVEAPYQQVLLALPTRLLRRGWNELRVHLYETPAIRNAPWRPNHLTLGLYGPVYLLSDNETLLEMANSILLSARETADCLPALPDSGHPYIDTLAFDFPRTQAAAQTLVYFTVDSYTGKPKWPAQIKDELEQIAKASVSHVYFPYALPAEVLPQLDDLGLRISPKLGSKLAFFEPHPFRNYTQQLVWTTSDGEPTEAFGKFLNPQPATIVPTRSFSIVTFILFMLLLTTWRVVDIRSLRSYLLLPANVLEKLQKIQQGRLNPPNFIFFLNLLRWLALSALLTLLIQAVFRQGGVVALGLDHIRLFTLQERFSNGSTWAIAALNLGIVAGLLAYQITIQLLVAGIYKLSRFSFRLQELAALGNLAPFLLALVLFLLLSLQPELPPRWVIWAGVLLISLGFLIAILLQFVALGRIWRIPLIVRILYVMTVSLLPLYLLL